MNYLVTGGAGFIGSHIVDELIKRKNYVRVYDNFSTGKNLFIRHHFPDSHFRLVKGDLLDRKLLLKSMDKIDFVFHFAAHADVKRGYFDHNIDHDQNLEVTRAVLEAMYLKGIKRIAFASSSSVYGDAKIHPTPEDYPFEPTSLYGATKAACESYIYSYGSYFNWRIYIFRMVSFLGERYTHGIIYDIMKMIKSGKGSLNLLSDGSPRKTSVYVKDGINAFFKIIDKTKNQVNIFNIGQDEILTVEEIVSCIQKKLNYTLPIKFKGEKIGWKGDNNFVYLDTSKLKKIGWKPKKTFREGINSTIDYLSKYTELFN